MVEFCGKEGMVSNCSFKLDGRLGGEYRSKPQGGDLIVTKREVGTGDESCELGVPEGPLAGGEELEVGNVGDGVLGVPEGSDGLDCCCRAKELEGGLVEEA
jgi:hypothetical protein